MPLIFSCLITHAIESIVTGVYLKKPSPTFSCTAAFSCWWLLSRSRRMFSMSERRRFRDSSLSLCAFCLSSSRWSVISARWRLCCAREPCSCSPIAANSASKDKILWTEKIDEGEWYVSVSKTVSAEVFLRCKATLPLLEQKKNETKLYMVFKIRVSLDTNILFGYRLFGYS